MEPASPQEANLWRLCRSGHCGANSWLSARRLGIPRGTFPAQQPEPRRRGEERDEGAGRAAGRSSKRQRPPQPSSAAGKAGEPGLWRAKRCPRVGGTEPGAPATITQRGSEVAPGTRLRRDESVGRRETLRGRPQPLPPPPPQRSVTPLPGASPSTRAHRRGCASFGSCLPKQVPTGRSRSPRSRCSWSASRAGLPGSHSDFGAAPRVEVEPGRSSGSERSSPSLPLVLPPLRSAWRGQQETPAVWLFPTRATNSASIQPALLGTPPAAPATQLQAPFPGATGWLLVRARGSLRYSVAFSVIIGILLSPGAHAPTGRRRSSPPLFLVNAEEIFVFFSPALQTGERAGGKRWATNSRQVVKQMRVNSPGRAG
ncbi:uncharacterized protein LOC114595463 [Podarcis muralis]